MRIAFRHVRLLVETRLARQPSSLPIFSLIPPHNAQSSQTCLMPTRTCEGCSDPLNGCTNGTDAVQDGRYSAELRHTTSTERLTMAAEHAAGLQRHSVMVGEVLRGAELEREAATEGGDSNTRARENKAAAAVLRSATAGPAAANKRWKTEQAATVTSGERQHVAPFELCPNGSCDYQWLRKGKGAQKL